MGDELVIVGRQSSHYTRFVRMFALEVEQPCAFEPIHELMARDADVFAGNPALKLPVLKRGDERVFGSMNICRALATAAGAGERVVWPEDADSTLMMNAHEIVAHAMGAHVEVIIHDVVEKRPPDNASRKRRDSLVNCLAWLEDNLDAVTTDPHDSGIGVLELQLYCLVEHLPFRNPVDLAGMPALREFVSRFGERESARATPYRFDHA